MTRGGSYAATARRFAVFSTLTPTGWALRTSDARASAALLRANGYAVGDPGAGSRATPDGRVLRWRSASITLPETKGTPFLIEWAADTPHPATTSPAGCTLETLTIWEANPAPLTALLGALGVGVQVEQGEPGMRMALKCPKGPVAIGR